jgi:hypothetical protein
VTDDFTLMSPASSRAPQSPLWGEDQEREALPIAGDAERAVPNARR